MGSRVSISFAAYTYGPDGSAILYDHSEGMFMVGKAAEYVRRLRAETIEYGGRKESRLARLDPSAVMFNFIPWYIKEHRKVFSVMEHDKDSDLTSIGCGFHLQEWRCTENLGHYVIDSNPDRDNWVYFVVDADECGGGASEIVNCWSLETALDKLHDQYYLIHDDHGFGNGGGVGDAADMPISWDFAIYRARSSDVLAYCDGNMTLQKVIREGGSAELVASGTYHVPRHDMGNYDSCSACNWWGEGDHGDCPKCGKPCDGPKDCECHNTNVPSWECKA